MWSGLGRVGRGGTWRAWWLRADGSVRGVSGAGSDRDACGGGAGRRCQGRRERVLRAGVRGGFWQRRERTPECAEAEVLSFIIGPIAPVPAVPAGALVMISCCGSSETGAASVATAER